MPDTGTLGGRCKQINAAFEFLLPHGHGTDTIRMGMKFYLLSGLAGVLVLGSTASAQIVNPSFETGDFSGWTTTSPLALAPGSPAVLPGGLQPINGTPSVLLDPVQGNFQAFIQSTGGASSDQGVTPAVLMNFLGVTTLPGNLPLFNGTAIKQTINVGFLGGARISFAYGYQSREAVASGLDETGYAINGQFHLLVDSTTPGVQPYTPDNGVFESFLPYQTTTVDVAPGANTLAFASYNTVITLSTTGLLIDNLRLVPLFGPVPGLTPNQRAVATYIDNHDLTDDPGFNNIINSLGMSVDPAQLGDALDQLSPQSLQIFHRLAFDNATFNTLDVTNHLANLRDGLTGFDPSQMTVQDPGLAPGASRIKSRLPDAKQMIDRKQMRDPKEIVDLDYQPARWSTFIVGSAVLGDFSHDEDMAHQDYTTGGVMLGADYRIDDHFTVGALVAYSHTDADLDHIGSSGTADSYSPGVYASYVDGPWYGNALFTYTFNSYTENRQIQFGDITASNQGAPSGNQYTGSLVGGYEFHSGDWKYGPFAGVQYVNLGINSFTEDGPTALDVQNQSAESFRTQLGFDVRYAATCCGTTLIPHASVAWQHECLDDDQGITSNFTSLGATAGTFTVQPTSVGRDAAVIDVGLDAGVCDNVTLFMDYATQAGADHDFAQSVSAGIRVGF